MTATGRNDFAARRRRQQPPRVITTNGQCRFRPAAARLLLGLCLILIAGCASPDKKVTERGTEEDKVEYEYYYPTGSNIPVKIPKGSLHTSAKRTAADQAQVKQTLERMPNQEKRAGGN